MTVGILVITHGGIGHELLETASHTLGICPLNAEALSVYPEFNIDEMDAMARVICLRLDTGDGVLVLTDMFGSTPSNIARRLLELPRVDVVTGINLPMLIRIMNYPKLPLDELKQKAISGGHDGILACQEESS
ncbi:MAG TPA: PTS fructose transporter subunit IIA [Gammaproteobacteria bacterium]|nr:PTS fructose transporter subunit IIA [Gammaproteobacteria bacterium]